VVRAFKSAVRRLVPGVILLGRFRMRVAVTLVQNNIVARAFLLTTLTSSILPTSRIVYFEAVHEKLAALSVLPVPLYVATCG
jgi:hypothetical protein